MREYAADIEELLAARGITRAAVVGLSMGGLVAMELAAAAPERYWALGLIATTMQPPSPRRRCAAAAAGPTTGRCSPRLTSPRSSWPERPTRGRIPR